LTQVTVPSGGSIKTADIGVYSNSGCTNLVEAIDWGSLEAGNTKNKLISIPISCGTSGLSMYKRIDLDFLIVY